MDIQKKGEDIHWQIINLDTQQLNPEEDETRASTSHPEGEDIDNERVSLIALWKIEVWWKHTGLLHYLWH